MENEANGTKNDDMIEQINEAKRTERVRF